MAYKKTIVKIGMSSSSSIFSISEVVFVYAAVVNIHNSSDQGHVLGKNLIPIGKLDWTSKKQSSIV